MTAGFVRTWSVGSNFTATLSCPGIEAGEQQAAEVQWSPHLPKKLTPAQLDEYRRGRDAALDDLAAHLGLRIGVVDVGG